MLQTRRNACRAADADDCRTLVTSPSGDEATVASQGIQLPIHRRASSPAHAAGVLGNGMRWVRYLRPCGYQRHSINGDVQWHLSYGGCSILSIHE